MKKPLMILASILITAALYGANTDIRLNSIGYRTHSLKKASIKAAAISVFYVVADPSGVTALAGTASSFGTNPDTSEAIWIADFSSVTTPGTYYLDVPGTGKSFDFKIGDGVFTPAFYAVFRGFYLWRCGTAVTGTHYYQGVTNTYTHAACHVSDAYKDGIGGGHVIKNGTAGWHDAGDFNKYVVNAGVTFGVLGKAWEYLKPNIEGIPMNLPAAPSAYPEYLRELKWETDWLLKMQAADGSVYHKLTAVNFCCDWAMPEDSIEDRFFIPYSTAATADFAAMMAQAYRLFSPYDNAYANQCLSAARLSYGKLTSTAGNVSAYNTIFNGGPAFYCAPLDVTFTTGSYETGDTDDRIWAAAEMWESTGQAAMLADFETRANALGSKISFAMDWGDVKNLGMFTYYNSARPGKSSTLMNAIRNNTISTADTYVNNVNSHGYGRVLGTQYWWGVNGAVARASLTLYMANQMSPKADYVDAANEILNYLFGRNYNCRSMVTGLGYNATLHPHDRRSSTDGIVLPWPGYLAGGPQPNATSWSDSEGDYTTNEIAINWNSALVFALAWLKDAPVFATPTITGTPPTVTVSPTITETHTVTPTWTITQTHTVTPTATITPTEIFDALEINEHYTYPNPSSGAPVTFRIANKGWIEKIKIRIFSYSARKIGEVEEGGLSTSLKNDIKWDPPYKKLGNGLYYYIMEAQGKNTPIVRKTGTFVIINNIIQN
jgi:endoglucanase